mgnify:CR=1 FL=1
MCLLCCVYAMLWGTYIQHLSRCEWAETWIYHTSNTRTMSEYSLASMSCGCCDDIGSWGGSNIMGLAASKPWFIWEIHCKFAWTRFKYCDVMFCSSSCAGLAVLLVIWFRRASSMLLMCKSSWTLYCFCWNGVANVLGSAVVFMSVSASVPALLLFVSSWSHQNWKVFASYDFDFDFDFEKPRTGQDTNCKSRRQLSPDMNLRGNSLFVYSS